MQLWILPSKTDGTLQRMLPLQAITRFLWLDCHRGCEETGRIRSTMLAGVELASLVVLHHCHGSPPNVTLSWVQRQFQHLGTKTCRQRCQLCVMVTVNTDVMNIKRARKDPAGCLMLASLFFCMDPDRLSELPCFLNSWVWPCMSVPLPLHL